MIAVVKLVTMEPAPSAAITGVATAAVPTAAPVANMEGATPTNTECTKSPVSDIALMISPSENLSIILGASSVMDILISGCGLESALSLYWSDILRHSRAWSSAPNVSANKARPS